MAKKNSNILNVLCERCGNEYEILRFKIREYENRHDKTVVRGSKCPYCKYINEEGNKK